MAGENIPCPEKSEVVAVGTPVVRNCTGRAFNHAISIIVKPTAGGTVTVEFSNSPLCVEDQANPANVWIDSGNGAMAAATEVARYAPCKAYRVTATAQPALLETKG